MLVLDENLPASQQQLLRKWRIHFRMVGVEVANLMSALKLQALQQGG